MGKEWLYKATGKKEKHKNSLSSGCMSAIYGLFDVQHHQYRFHHMSLMSSESVVNDYQQSDFCLQGIEAPRNSLESPESAMKVAHSLSKVKEHMNLKIPVSRIYIKTNPSKSTDGLSTENCNTPGTKTPNLVARLMGLDLLPEYSSPRASASSVTANSHHRSRSLPATPRLSTASRRSTDNNDYHHRLSLQIDKENRNIGQEHESLHVKIKNHSKEKEKASRRLGTDITNTISPARGKCHRRDLNLVLLKPKAPIKETAGKAKRDESKQLSCSQKIRVLDIKTNLIKPISNSPKLHQMRAMKKPENIVKDEKIKRITSERYDLRLKKMGQQEKVFVNKKSTALPKHVLKVSLPSNLNSSYNSNNTHNLQAASAATTTTSATATFASSCSFFNFERSMRRLLSTAFVAEVEEIVAEIEREIFGNLVVEIATESPRRWHVTG
ncbi:hypothetical protein M8C21_021502 [Ambrosia artemisiifolia]|uniref:DUF3741 domain-containing protein n=1 Tax=Ambrosia artemisiifolia TaxID=4212 RepID=A0AAD5GD82_AMBAR|nr:hypothetical protein M8C21_021502 [Ambrosia artemisiifolia]